jgi:lipopolysaccharide export system permease protein
LVLNLNHIQVESRDVKNPEDFTVLRPILSGDHLALRLPLGAIFGQNSFHPKLQWYSLSKLRAEWQRLAQPVLPAEKAQRELDRMKLRIVVQDKFTTAFAVFSFALVAIPLGIKVSRKETSANLGLALGLALGYYFLTVAIGWLDRYPAMRPDLLMWMPNLIFVALGLWMFWRVDRR